MDIIIEKKGLSKKHWAWIIGGVIILAIILWLLFGDHSAKLRVDTKTITLSEVVEEPFNDYIRLSGKVQPGSVIQISALEGGVVEQIHVTEGSTVKKGDIILSLQNQNLNLQILDSEAQLAEKQNFLRNTQITMEQEKLNLQQEMLTVESDLIRKERAYKLKKTLYDEDLGSKEEYLQAEEDFLLAQNKKKLIINRQKQDSLYRKIQMDQMEESLHNMQLNLSIVRKRVDNLQIRAPYDGQLGVLGNEQSTISIGQNISSGQSIGQINILDSYRIEVSIDEHYIDRISAGLSGTFERQNTGYNVEISKVYPEVRGGTFRSDLVFSGDHPDNIRVGQTYYINLQLSEPTEGILIPKGEFYQATGGKWIFVVSKDGKQATKRAIRVGRQNPKYYEIVEGLEPGEQVITSSYQSYGDAETLLLQ